jgi:biopolymer transport protein TolR
MGIPIPSSSRGVKAEINVVPLIDILLVLLIIFMVITPMTSRGLEALVPQQDRSAGPTVEPIAIVVVQLDASGAVRINAEVETWATLGRRLTMVFRQRAEKVAFLRADDPVEFADIARAIEIMRDAGIERVGLLTPRVISGL